MANIKFTQLPNLGNITAATIVPVVDSGVNYTITAANLQNYINGSNISAVNISATGNITGGNLISSGSIVSVGNVSGANYTGTSISVSGNVTGAYIIGNGSLLTGLPPTYTNANVASFMSAYGSNTISTTGTITGGNISGTYFIGNGSQLTGLPPTYTNANVAAYLPTYTGNLAGGNLSVTGNVTGKLYKYTELLTSSTGVTSFTPTFTTGSVQRITLSGNLTLNAPSGMTAGSSITLIIQQSASGNCLMTPDAVYKFSYGLKTLSTSANAIDMMSIFYDGTNYLCNLVKGYV